MLLTHMIQSSSWEILDHGAVPWVARHLSFNMGMSKERVIWTESTEAFVVKGSV